MIGLRNWFIAVRDGVATANARMSAPPRDRDEPANTDLIEEKISAYQQRDNDRFCPGKQSRGLGIFHFQFSSSVGV